AFRILRECYEELGRPAGAPLATLSAAFIPHDTIVLPDRKAGAYVFRTMTNGRNGGVPGCGLLVRAPWEYVIGLLGTVAARLRAVVGLVGGDAGGRALQAIGEELPRVRGLVDRALRGVEGAAAAVAAAIEG